MFHCLNYIFFYTFLQTFEHVPRCKVPLRQCRPRKSVTPFFSTCARQNFPDPAMRANFLVKFYQCLLSGQLPLKTRKLCLVGPSDSGKSSMAQVLSGLNLATISKEKTFGLSMINDHTQLVFIDEMNADLLPADVAKIFLQGDMLTVSRKHANAEIIDNSAGKIYFR